MSRRPPLQKVRIWLEYNEQNHACAVYHPDRKWLIEHDMNPDKAKCVEISNAKHFLSWTLAQPSMVLHEMAHAYHHRFLPKGFQNPAILKCYRGAMKGGAYDEVIHCSGNKKRHYGANNHHEYFAEASEAYFGQNDFYPFMRTELKQHDAEIYDLLRKMWGVDP